MKPQGSLDIRAVIIAGEPWFLAADVALAGGYPPVQQWIDYIPADYKRKENKTSLNLPSAWPMKAWMLSVEGVRSCCHYSGYGRFPQWFANTAVPELHNRPWVSLIETEAETLVKAKKPTPATVPAKVERPAQATAPSPVPASAPSPLKTFGFEGVDVRLTDRDGNPWFVLADVCRVLEIGNSRDAAARLDGDEKNTIAITDGNRGNPNVTIINESGLYSLILTSRKPAAKRFKKWVTSEVLPAIRKDGAYVMGGEKGRSGEMSGEELVIRALTFMQEKVARLTAERDVLSAEVNMVTVDEYRALNHRYWGQSEKTRLGARASKLAREQGIALESQTRTLRRDGKEREVSVKVYPRHLLPLPFALWNAPRQTPAQDEANAQSGGTGHP